MVASGIINVALKARKPVAIVQEVYAAFDLPSTFLT
jgi:hypothetical protein